MSTQSSVQGSVTLRKLRSGATASVSLSSTKQLFQLYSVKSGGSGYDYAPNWTVSGNAPVVTVNATSSSGQLEVTDVQWSINGTQADTIAGITKSSSGGVHSLTIAANLAPLLNFTSGTLTAAIFVKDASQPITKTEDIRIQQAVDNGYNVMINCNKAYVDASTSASNPTRLTAVCYRGIAPVESDITYKWYRGTGTSASDLLHTGATYDVTDPDDINGTQLYICRAYDGTDTEVDAEGILIVDNSDPYFLAAQVQQSKGGTNQPLQDNVTSVNVASDHDAAKVTFRVLNSDGTDYGKTPAAWSVEKKHADTMNLIGQVSGAAYTTDTATASTYNTKTYSGSATGYIDVYDADYISNSGGTNHDTEVIVTATATL